MKSKDNIINFEDFRTVISGKPSKVFTGRDRGAEVRSKSKIDDLLSSYGSVTLVIPNDIYSITPSFLEEFLKTSVEKYGREVLSKIILSSDNEYDLSEPMDEAIDRILSTSTALN